MKPGRRLFHIAALLVLLVPLAVTSTPPHIVWYLFQVSGQVVRPAGPLDNYTVILMRYDDRLGWKRAGECIVGSVTEYGPLISVALTDENGAFALNTSECDDFGDLASDTLAVAVVLPDTVLMGAPFRVNSGQRIEAEVTVDEGGSLCDDNEYTFVDGYIYRFPPRTITIP